MNNDEVTQLVNELHSGWYSALVRHAARVTGSVDLAEDIVQEAFLQLCGQILSGAVIGSPKAWTLRVVRREISKRLYRDKDRGITFESLETALPVVTVEPNEELDDLSRFLACLTPREEEVVCLRLEGHRYAEIAGSIGVSLNTVKTLLARAMKKMQAVTSKGRLKNHRWNDVERRSSETRQ